MREIIALWCNSSNKRIIKFVYPQLHASHMLTANLRTIHFVVKIRVSTDNPTSYQ